MAGPVPGIVLGSILLILSGYVPEEIYSLAEFLVIINFFNLIPVAVLDGGNIFETLFIPNNNKKIGIFNLVTGTGSLIYCFLYTDYFIIWLCILIILRGVLFFIHREEPPIISLSGILKPKQKILFTTIWCSTILIALISLF